MIRPISVGGVERRIETQGEALMANATIGSVVAELPVELQPARVAHERTVGREDDDVFALENEAAPQAFGEAVEPDVDPEDPRRIRHGTPAHGDAVSPTVPKSIRRRGHGIGRGHGQGVPGPVSGVVIDLDRQSLRKDGKAGVESGLAFGRSALRDLAGPDGIRRGVRAG